MLVRPEATFELARRVGSAEATLGEVFSFLSALYFRGKLAYARHFARPRRTLPGVLVISPDRGLLLPETKIGITELKAFAEVPIDVSDARYRLPFERDAEALSARCRRNSEIVLLGSIATDKYVKVAAAAFGSRLRFPTEFAGRGDMSRGGLLLRSVRDEKELAYTTAFDAPVERLPQRSRRSSS